MAYTCDTPIMAGNNRCEMAEKKKQKPQTTHAVVTTNEFTLSGALLGAPDALGVVLEEVDAAALRQLKAASVAWRAHARRELCSRLWIRLSRHEGQPEPTGVDSITDLDVECLDETGRSWEVVIAGRQLPQLARLHGYGFVLDLQAVRGADLSTEEDNLNAPLGGNKLCDCMQGEGEPPAELRFAAVACAASGAVRGIPVQQLREDNKIDCLNLMQESIKSTGAALLAFMLPTATSLRSLMFSTNSNPSFSFVSAPLPLLPSHRSNLTHALQYWVQQDRRQGRLRARSHPQGDDDLQPQVRRHPIVVFLFCQPPLTRLLSHLSHPAPRLQYWGQQHRSRGRLRARRHPQGDADHHPGVSHRPRLFAFVSAPIDTPTLSPSPSHLSLAVSRATASETRAPPRSQPSSRRR